MTTKRAKRSTRGAKNLKARNVSGKQAKAVKGGYIGETEKLRAGAVRDGTSNT